MNNNKKLLLMLLIGLVLGILLVLGIQMFTNKEDLDNDDNVPVVNEPVKEDVTFIIYVDTDATASEIEDLQTRIKDMDLTISSLVFKDKAEVLKEELAKLSGEEKEKSKLNTYTNENNTLEHQLILSVKNVSNKKELSQKLKIFVNVTDVKY